MTPPDLRPLLDPRSIAIIGASADFTRINGRPLKFLLQYGYGGVIYPVNPRYQEVAGVRCYATIEDVPAAPDLVLIGLGAGASVAALEACGRRGARAAVVFAGGFAEVGDQGRELQARLVDTASRYEIALCGPNCLGFANIGAMATCSFTATFDSIDLRPGPIACVSQSGAVGAYVYALAHARGMGFSYYISSGNEACVDFADYVDYLVDDPKTRVILGYLESARQAPRLLGAADRALAAGKPLVLLKVGRSRTGARAARSHTGSLAGEDRVYSAAFKQHGIIRAEGFEDMLDIAYMATVGRLPQGRSMAVSTVSGGGGVLLADEADRQGLRMAELTETTRERLASVIPSFGSTANPIDTTAQALNDPGMLRGCLEILAEDPCVDVVVPFQGPLEEYADGLAETICAVAANTERLVVANWILAPIGARRRLEAAGVPVFDEPRRLVRAVAALAEWRQRRDSRYLSSQISPT